MGTERARERRGSRNRVCADGASKLPYPGGKKEEEDQGRARGAERTARTIISPSPAPSSPASWPSTRLSNFQVPLGEESGSSTNTTAGPETTLISDQQQASKQAGGCGRSSLLPRPSSLARGSTDP